MLTDAVAVADAVFYRLWHLGVSSVASLLSLVIAHSGLTGIFDACMLLVGAHSRTTEDHNARLTLVCQQTTPQVHMP